MSLFLRLWIIGTVIALAATGIAISAHMLVTGHQVEHYNREQLATAARLVSHSMAADPLAERADHEIQALLQERARDFISTGKLLSVSVLDRDLNPLVQEALPGLEEEEALQRLGLEPFQAVMQAPSNRVVLTEDALYFLAPLADSATELRGVLAVGMPMDALAFDDRAEFLFATLAFALSVLLGLVAAMALTGQVARPIGRLAQVADRLDSGRFDTGAVSSLIDRRDEIGRLARVMLRLVQALDHLGAEMQRESSGGSGRKPTVDED